MWGNALRGLATCFVAPVFRQNRTEKITAGLMVANGAVSILGGFVTSANLGWVHTLPGLIGYLLWNVLVLVLSVFYLLSFRRKIAGLSSAVETSQPLEASRA